VKGAEAIAETSVYRDAARTLATNARAKLVLRHVITAEKKRGDGNCTAARKEAEAALAMEADNTRARDVIARCGHHKGGGIESRLIATHTVASSHSIEQPLMDKPPSGGPEKAAPVDITPRSDADKARRRPIDSNDPYAKDQ
jgi:hypothetical protein